MVPLLVATLTGCSTSTSGIVDATRMYFAAPAVDSAVLNPKFSYLRVTVEKNVALLVLGYVDSAPKPGTEVWYSADKETVRLWHGRIAGTAGLNTDWRTVQFGQVPSWHEALAQRGDASYDRQRDVMPGYGVNIRDRVRILPIPAPKDSRWVGTPNPRLQWFQETTSPEGPVPGLPSARFAVDLSGKDEHVVYSEQCLSAAVCLTFQSWPAANAPSPTAPL